VQEGSALDGIALMEMGKFKAKVLICAVERGEREVYIPSGEFRLKAGDHISIVATPVEALRFFRQIGIVRSRVRQCMIIGGGRISFYLAKQLLAAGMDVKIIESDMERCETLSELLPEASVICGDGTDQRLLQEEGIEHMDAVVSLTGVDEENIIISMYAKAQSNAKVITKVNKLSLKQMASSVGLDSFVSPKLLTANTIIQYVRAVQNAGGSGIVTLYKLVDDQVEAIEFIAREGSKILNRPLKELSADLKKDLLIAGIIRGNKVIIPNGDDYIAKDDSVIVVTSNRYFQDLDEIIQ